ncbi:MAG: MXAN_6577-like cysteine-rich protein [Cystobacter sp.]
MMPMRCLGGVLSLFLVLTLTGCRDEGPLCAEGQSACEGTCVDLSSSASRCGACDVACSATQQCVQGACGCRAGTVLCGGACVVPASDPAHCGGCAGEGGVACGAEQVCERGECKAACALPSSVLCGRSCVDVRSDGFHCGGCDEVCTDARSCHAGLCTNDVVAACFNTGQVVGIQAGTDVKGPAVGVGTAPISLATLQDVLLVVDVSSRLLQARLSDYGELPARTATGLVPNQVLTREPFVFVINSTSNTLQVLRREGAPAPGPGPRFPSGLTLTNVGSVNFGGNTNPYAFTLEGTEAYVTLLGNLQSDASAGGRVARVSLADPTAPVITEVYVLPSGEALQPFPGRVTLSAPAGITSFRGRVYATLGNLDARDYAAGGPGFLARIDPGSRAVDLLELGGTCLNPYWVQAVGERLLVSCGGGATYDEDFNLTDVRGTGLVLLDAEGRVLHFLPLGCPEATSCPLASAGRFAVVGSRAYVGDNNAGRVFVIEVVGDTLVERKGLGPGAAPPIAVCPRSTGPSLVSDVLAVP